MESQVALARPPRAAGGDPGGRQAGAQRGRAARVLPSDGIDHSKRHGVRAAHRAYPYDPTQAKRLLAEAGYPNGFDAGDLTPLPPFTTMGEAVANDLATVGIRTRVRSMERATFMEAWRSKKLGGVFVTVSAAPGNTPCASSPSSSAAPRTRPAGMPTSTICSSNRRRSATATKREALLHQIQRLMHERVMYGPIFEPATLHGIGPRVEEAAMGLSPQLYFTAP